MLKITNNLTGNLEPLVPITDHPIRLYVCGVTPYDHAHVGHGRCYVTFDFLYRLLRFLGYRVSYCRNFTDIDDKLINKAVQEFNDSLQYHQVADRYITSFKQDVLALNCISPTYEPRVTDNIETIIEFIEKLVSNGSAYESDGDVYFSIEKSSNYGALSKRNIADLHAGARVEPNEKKKNPLDFALWKSEPAGMYWQSPFGWGRPGWHIECSALAYKYLGDQIDIHGGGMDLIFPHHENEIAQTEALTQKQFSRFWMHNAFVQVNKEKMSKSLGNFFTLKDIFAQIHPMVVRFYFLNHHYRSPLEFSLEALKEIEKSYLRLCRFFAQHQAKPLTEPTPVQQKMIAFLCDDLNSVGLWGVLFEHLSHLTPDEIATTKYMLHEILGLTLELPAQKEITSEIQALIDARNAARAAGDWLTADRLRKQLQELGFEVQDKKSK